MVEKIGLHRIRHGDLVDGISGLMAGDAASFVYSDPPWGAGNLAYWQTMNQKMTGQDPRPTDLGAFLPAFFGAVRDHTTEDALVFVEYGQRWRGQIRDFVKTFGFEVRGLASPVYGRKPRPLDLWALARPGRRLWSEAGREAWQASVNGTTGYGTLLAATESVAEEMRGAILLDPCCGLGYSARLAVQRGAIFYGNELNAARLDKTRLKLVKSCAST